MFATNISFRHICGSWIFVLSCIEYWIWDFIDPVRGGEGEGGEGRQGRADNTLFSTNRTRRNSRPVQWELSFTGCREGDLIWNLCQHVLCRAVWSGGASIQQDKMSETRYLIFNIKQHSLHRGNPTSRRFSRKPLDCTGTQMTNKVESISIVYLSIISV